MVLIPLLSPSFSNKFAGMSPINSDGAFILRDPKIVRKLANDKNNFSFARVIAT